MALKLTGLLLLGAVAGGGWVGRQGAGSPSTQTTASPATSQTTSWKLPDLGASQVVDYPGLVNVVAFAPGLYSGAVPEGEEGFASLQKLGIRTVLTVDGATPDVERARRFGLRYVHIPVTYAGITREQTLAIARAVRDLPKPIYLHCHHGKHRSAAAAGVASVTLGLLGPEEAIAKMKLAGTSPQYPGLYQCVNLSKVADVAALETADHAFPETHAPGDFVGAMIEIDDVFDRLKQIDKAGWVAPADHPDLVPAAEAGKLVDLYRQAHARPTEFVDGGRSTAELVTWVAQAQRRASELEEGLVRKDPAEASRSRFKLVAQSCTDCHAKYRNAAIGE